MLEIKVFIDYYSLTHKHTMRAKKAPMKNIFGFSENLARQVSDDRICKHYLKRFTALGPAKLKETIKNCEAQGLLSI